MLIKMMRTAVMPNIDDDDDVEDSDATSAANVDGDSYDDTYDVDNGFNSHQVTFWCTMCGWSRGGWVEWPPSLGAMRTALWMWPGVWMEPESSLPMKASVQQSVVLCSEISF